MANISENLEKILSARYGEEVRGAIHDSIRQCAEVNGNYVGPSNVFIDSYDDAQSAGFTDANTNFGEFNKLYIITDSFVKNLPPHAGALFFITLSWDTNVTVGNPNEHVGILQIAFSDPGGDASSETPKIGGNVMYVRSHAKRGSTINDKCWSDWTTIGSSSNSILSSTTIGSDGGDLGIDDLNDVEHLINKIVFFASGRSLKNEPTEFVSYSNSTYRTVMTFTPFKLDDYRPSTDVHGIVQLMFLDCRASKDYNSIVPSAFVRYETGSGSIYHWSKWIELGSTYSTITIHNEMLRADYFSEHGITSMKQLPTNRIYMLDLTDAFLDDIPDGIGSNYALMISATHTRTYDWDTLPAVFSPGSVQMLFVNQRIDSDSTDAQFFIRTVTGNDGAQSWSSWKELTKEASPKSLNIFRKVVCCGDSYTAGYVDIDSTIYGKNEDYAWPHYLSVLTGNTYINAGASGANVLTWQNDTTGSNRHEDGYDVAISAGVAQAYIIGLGINDASSDYPHHIDLGTKSDMGTASETYYGQYVEMLKKLHAISPKAIFFLQTNPRSDSTVASYNQAVKDIVDYAKSTLNYRAHLIDLDPNVYNNDPILTADSLAGHYTAIGYSRFAELLYDKISSYINAHITEFQDVFLLPTE